MNPLFAAAGDFLAFCGARGWKCCVIGGLAVQRWGEPRQTRDVGLTLLASLGGEERFVDPILQHYHGRFQDARRFALERRVLLVETADRIPMDVSLGGLPYEGRVIERSSPFEVEPSVRLITCSAEDLVVLKAFSGRPQDWLDIEGVVARQGSGLDRSAVLTELKPLLELKEDTTSEPRLLEIFEKHRD